MTTPSRITAIAFAILFALSFAPAFAASSDAFSSVKSQADLDALIASTGDAALKQAIRDNAAAILAAAEQRPQVEAVIHTLTSAPGKFEKVNTTPEGLKKAAGGDIALFDTLKLVDLSVPGMGPHDHRKVDPFDAAFFEHLSHIAAMESLNIISTQANDEWIAPLGRLTNLKKLIFVNNGKLTDTGLEHLAGLSKLEQFSYVGTGMKGHAFAKFEGWTKLTRCSFRGSSIDDEGLKQLCEHFPNLESISLAHAKFADAGAVNLARLTKLKGLELGTHSATPQCLLNVAKLPLDYLQLGEGFDGPEAIALIKDIKTLHRLTLTNAKGLKDADVKVVAGMTQLQSLEFGNLDLPDDRVAILQPFTFLKSLRLVHGPKGYGEETEAKIKAMLPHVALTFK
jgi:hypothetical protein